MSTCASALLQGEYVHAAIPVTINYNNIRRLSPFSDFSLHHWLRLALLINQACKLAEATQTIKKDGFMKNYMNFIRNFIM